MKKSQAVRAPMSPKKVKAPEAAPASKAQPEPEGTAPTLGTDRRVPYYVAGFVAAVLIFIVSTWLAVQYKTMAGWEITVFNAINGMPDGLRILGLIATVTPESLMIGAAAVVVIFFCKLYRLAWRLSVAIIGGYAVTAVAKYVIGRPRPGELLNDVALRAHDTGMGFPSGHTMLITILSLMFIPYLPGKWKLIVPIPIIMMGWSRVYLGLHAPLDIIGGFAIGLGVVCFLRILPRSIKTLTRLD